MRDGLAERGWAVRSLFRAAPSNPVDDSLVGSVSNLELMEAACDGMDAVIHLAGIASPSREWHEYLDSNIDGTRTVLEAARLRSVPRVVLASSNHAAGFVRRGSGETSANTAPRPDSLYGVSKAAVEALGSYYADQYGLRTTSLRIGSFADRPTTRRMLSTWLSRNDLLRLAEAALAGPWASHEVVWGISKNTRRWWSLDAGERIGYFPQDDAEDFAEGLEGESSEYVGGSGPPFGA